MKATLNREVEKSSLQKIRTYLQMGLENPLGLQGVVTWVVTYLTDLAERSSYHIAVDFSNHTISEWLADYSTLGDAQIVMPLEVLNYLVENIHTVDYRDPRIKGQWSVRGDLKLVNHMLKALLLPSEENMRRIAFAADRKVPAYAIRSVKRVHNPSELDVLECIESGTPLIATGTVFFDSRSPWTLEEISRIFGAEILQPRSSDEQETVAQFVHRLSLYLKGDSEESLVEGFTKPYTEGCALPRMMLSDFVPPWFSLDEYLAPPSSTPNAASC